MLIELAYPTALFDSETGEKIDELTLADLEGFAEYASRTGYTCHLTAGHVQGDLPGSIGRLSDFQIKDGKLCAEATTDSPLSENEGFSIEFVRDVFEQTGEGTFLPFLIHRVAATSGPVLKAQKLAKAGSLALSFTSLRQPREGDMKLLAVALGLPEGATEEELVLAVKALNDKVSALSARVSATDPKSIALSRIALRKKLIAAAGESDDIFNSLLDEDMVEVEVSKGKDLFPYEKLFSLSRQGLKFKTPPQPNDDNLPASKARAKRIAEHAERKAATKKK